LCRRIAGAIERLLPVLSDAQVIREAAGPVQPSDTAHAIDTIAELARDAAMSPYHFLRVFERVVVPARDANDPERVSRAGLTGP